MIILGIESSCDDTSVALVDCSDSGFFVIAEKTASQIEVHKKYGGVVPEVAGRMHAENIVPLIETVIAEGNEDKPFDMSQGKPDVIAVTAGPGLVTGLVVGVEAAKTLSYLWDVPLVAVNHIAGHVHSVQISDFKFQNANLDKHQDKKSAITYPAIALIVSGGHTELLLMRDPTTFELIGKTRDDAAGECFDKVGKLLGFEYPGGPMISQFATDGDPKAIEFPRPMLEEDNYDFSFAGLKTSALYWLRDNFGLQTTDYRLRTPLLNDFCASFEQAIIDTLVGKTIRAAERLKPKTIILGGGVSANKKLRESLQKTIKQLPLISSFQFPISRYCMDNGAMIAVAGYYKAIKREYTDWRKIEVDPNWKVYE